MSERQNPEPATHFEPIIAVPVEPLSTRTGSELWLETGVVLVLAVLPALYRACDSLYSQTGNTPSFDRSRLWLSLLSVQISVPVLYLVWRSSEPWPVFGLGRPKWLIDTLAALGIWVVAIVATSQMWVLLHLLSEPAYDVLSTSRKYPLPVLPHNSFGYVLLVVSCLVGAFSEELVMRGYLIPRFERLLNSTWRALLLTTVLFAACHVYQGPHGVVNAMVKGFVFGSSFCLFRRIWPLVLAHALINIVVWLSR